MGRDKRKDDILFDCSNYDEKYYVAKLYPEAYNEVMEFLELKCRSKDFYHSNHMHVYRQIKQELGYEIPVSTSSR